jgi:hypothetical protein
MKWIEDDELDDMAVPDTAYGDILRRHRIGEPVEVAAPITARASLESLLGYFDVQTRQTYLRGVPYAEYLKSEHWQLVRREALARAYRQCQRCSSIRNLNVHHRTYENLGAEEDADLIVLCRSCHEKEHGL